MQAAVPGCFVKRWWGAWASKVSTGDFCARFSRAALFAPRDHAKKDPKKLCAFWGFISVPVMGVEPIRCHHQRILSPSRLPIPTHRLICCLYSILQAWQKIKIYFALIFTPQIRSKSTLDIPHIIGLSFFFGGVFPYHAGIFPGNRCGKGQRGNLCYAGNHLPDPHFLAVVPFGAGVDLVGVPAFRNHLR